jgi:hypothetical protein
MHFLTFLPKKTLKKKKKVNKFGGEGGFYLAIIITNTEKT